MKEKRILAMFITAAITLVASLSITFGVLNNSLVTKENGVVKIKDSIVFQPSSALDWTDENGVTAVWFKDTSADQAKSGYNCEIMFADESVSTKVKVIPLRISNEFDQNVYATVKVTFDNSTLLGKYTFVQIYDFNEKACKAVTSFSTQIDAGAYADYAVVVYANDAENTGRTSVNFGTDYEQINVEVTTNIEA